MSSAVLGGSAAAGLVLAALLFRTTKARLIAAGTLLPLVAFAGVLLAAGEREREEAEDMDVNATVFGDGKHELGGSHAGAGKEPAESATHPAASTSGGELEKWLAPVVALDGLTWPDKGKRYTSGSLWNRINGAAEMYREYGLKGAYFATARTSDTDIEIQLFDMGTAENAEKLFVRVTDKAEPAAILWEGGGEMRKDRYYARIVVSGVGDSDAVKAAPKTMLEALGATFEKKAAPKPAAPPATLLKQAKSTEVRTNGWGGRAYLGNTLVGEMADESEAFVAAPPDPDQAFKDLVASVTVASEKDGVVTATDPYQGNVLLSRKAAAIVGVAGYEDANTALLLLKEVLASL